MCSRCKKFEDAVELKSASQLEALLSRVYREGVAAGVLEVVEGSLGWADDMDCLLACRRCGDRLRLRCETYHGLGGRFEFEARSCDAS